jgi:hypothetical protein
MATLLLQGRQIDACPAPVKVKLNGDRFVTEENHASNHCF